MEELLRPAHREWAIVTLESVETDVNRRVQMMDFLVILNELSYVRNG